MAMTSPHETVYARVGPEAGAHIKQLAEDYSVSVSKLIDQLFSVTISVVQNAMDDAFAKSAESWRVSRAQSRRAERRKHVVAGPQLALPKTGKQPRAKTRTKSVKRTRAVAKQVRRG